MICSLYACNIICESRNGCRAMWYQRCESPRPRRDANGSSFSSQRALKDFHSTRVDRPRHWSRMGLEYEHHPGTPVYPYAEAGFNQSVKAWAGNAVSNSQPNGQPKPAIAIKVEPLGSQMPPPPPPGPCPIEKSPEVHMGDYKLPPALTPIQPSWDVVTGKAGDLENSRWIDGDAKSRRAGLPPGESRLRVFLH